jgi:3-hydroxybutyryl-CoA dehydratase
MKAKPADLNFDDIEIGGVYEFKKTFCKEDLDTFSLLSGDLNPLHLDEEYAGKTIFKKNVVFGMLSSSLFSALVGMHCPGKKALYLSQTLNFRKPLFLETEITVRGTVVEKNKNFKVIKIKTEILDQENIYVSGDAKVKIL